MLAVCSGEVRGEVGTRSQSQPEDGHCPEPKHVVDLYVVNYIYIPSNKVAFDQYIHFILVYF